MKIKQYQVDAFASRAFEGNPAAVCPLDNWLDDALMQSIAMENNLSETAFFVPRDDGFQLRWFTPMNEVKFCGHATLASAHVLFNHLGYSKPAITFETLSGRFIVTYEGDRLDMDFPAIPPGPSAVLDALAVALGIQPMQVLEADDYIAVFAAESDILALEPDFARLAQLDLRGVIATAPGDNVDFVSRFFAPKYGIPEDPVTGSAHCELTPFWSQRLGKQYLIARQLSRRGGELYCQMKGDRVVISGKAVTFMEGDINL